MCPYTHRYVHAPSASPCGTPPEGTAALGTGGTGDRRGAGGTAGQSPWHSRGTAGGWAVPESGVWVWVSPIHRPQGLKPRAWGCAGSREGCRGALHTQRCRGAAVVPCGCNAQLYFGFLWWKCSGLLMALHEHVGEGWDFSKQEQGPAPRSLTAGAVCPDPQLGSIGSWRTWKCPDVNSQGFPS